jgi:hypothetical protein
MEFYLGTNKNEMLSITGKWMELENIILSKVRQAQKAKSHTGMQGKRNLIHYRWECKLVKPLWKSVWRSFKK